MKLWLDDQRARAGASDLLAMGEGRGTRRGESGSFPPFRGTSPRPDGMNAVVAHDGEGDSDAGEKDQGRSADQERHAQEDRPEEDGCSAKACGTEEDRGNEGSGSEEDSDPEEAGRQESHDPEEDSDPEEAGRQESHDPEEDCDPEAVGNQYVRAAGCPSPSSSGAHGVRRPWGP